MKEIKNDRTKQIHKENTKERKDELHGEITN